MGVAAAVQGAVQLTREAQVGKIVESGESIFLKDEIKTDEKGSLQVLLLDETTFTIGANSVLVIDKFIYDPSTSAGQVNARVVKGTFRFITGKIARKKPEDMQVALPAGTIGIRGTMVMGKVEGDKSLVMLTGPGDKNNTGNKHGEILVSNEGKTVQIAKTGFGTQIDGAGSAPSAPFLVPAEMINEMTGALNPSAGSDAGSEDAAGEEGSATENSGQGTVDAVEDLSATESIGELTADLAAETETASHDAAEEAGSIQDGITTIEQLLTIQSGQFHFEGTSFPVFDVNDIQVGNFDIHYNIDFGARTIGGGLSHLNGNAAAMGTGVFNFPLPGVSFAGGSGDAVFTYPTLNDVSCGCNADITVAALNSNGVIAAEGIVVLEVDDGVDTDTGFGIAPRLDGLS